MLIDKHNITELAKSTAEFSKIYKFPYEICDHKKIVLAIKEKDSKYFCLDVVTPNMSIDGQIYKYIFVIDPAIDDIVWSNLSWYKFSNKHKGDVNDLVNAIKGQKKK